MSKEMWYTKLGYAHNPFIIKPGFFDDEVVGYDSEVDKLVSLLKDGEMAFLEGHFGLGKTSILKTQVSKKGEDMKGKFGRVLGDFDVYDFSTDSWRPATKIMIEEGHAVPYFGGSKDDVDAQHLANRDRLIKEGVVVIG